MTSVPLRAAPAVSHNTVGQKLGRKGQETRERILAAMLRLIGDADAPAVTLTSVAREASIRLPNLYLYFPDMGELLLAALGRVMETAEATYLDLLRERWPDASLRDACHAFLVAHFDFWRDNARLLHMRNALADAHDVRVMDYRNTVTLPLIRLLARQMERDADGPDSSQERANAITATVLMTSIERLATVLTNPRFRAVPAGNMPADRTVAATELLDAEAEIMALAIANRRKGARQGA